jgi:hypothetical protein
MPALNEAQRQKQIALAKKSKQSPKPKPGQKGQQTGNKGSSTKAETIGGAKPKPKPKATPADTGRYIPGDQQVQFQQPVQRKSPAIGAPVHASPSAFGSAPKLQQQAVSPYVGSSAATPPRPSTPAQAPNPFAGIGDVRGNGLGQSPVAQDAQFSTAPAPQEYGGQKLQGIDENGIDMERRRAFLDAGNSLDGMKAVRDLLNRRKLSISVES